MDKLLDERELRLLKASVELETLSDLHAAAHDLRTATEAMKQANAARRCVFGRLDPNELRERTIEALRTIQGSSTDAK